MFATLGTYINRINNREQKIKKRKKIKIKKRKQIWKIL